MQARRGTQAAHVGVAGRRPTTWRSICPRRTAQRQACVKTDAPVVVGDIGGTNARLALWRGGAEIHKQIYPTKEYATFEGALEQFLDEPVVKQSNVRACAFAVAGAVENNRCAMTNIDWVIDGHELGLKWNFRVAVLNDFEAVGYGAIAVSETDLFAVNDVPSTAKAPKVVIGPGTGLGAAQLIWDQGLQRYRVWPGEGTHATFAPRGWKQMALSEYVAARYGHTEIEQVCCGSGLSLIYEFLSKDEMFNRPTLLPTNVKTPPEITSSGVDGSDVLAVETLDIFLAILGAEAGAMALRCLARGGVYIAGGIVPRLLKKVEEGGLKAAFINEKGREKFTSILRTIPLHVITNTDAGLIGCNQYALYLLQTDHI